MVNEYVKGRGLPYAREQWRGLGLSEVQQVYQCVVCPKAFSSKQSLRAHLKVHKRQGYKRTTVLVRSDDWARFEEFCRAHKTTTCHLLSVLVQATLKGADSGVVKIGSPNPVVIQVQSFFLGSPRSSVKREISQDAFENTAEMVFEPDPEPNRRCVWCGEPGVMWVPQFLTAHNYQKRWFCQAHAPRRS